MFKKVRLVPAAASNSSGKATLRIPVAQFFSGMATIDPLVSLTGHEVNTITVDTISIDSLDIADVGFIKIDVEGHEDAVLEGAEKTIRRCRPNLLIEAEERYGREHVCKSPPGFASLDILAI